MGFSLDWLALREAADGDARDDRLRRGAAQLAGDNPVVMDLGCGSGSTARALSEVLPENTQWRLVDNDPVLLDTARRSVGADSSTHQLDIDDVASLPQQGATLVTASALLDLVTESWLERFISIVDVPFYAALTYNGTMRWDPPLPEDALITDAFNRHQRSDKGLGPALGPQAVTTAHRVFRAAGRDVTIADSPWELGPESHALQEALVEGIAAAAREMGETAATAWGKARVAAAPDTHCTVGHEDILVSAPRLKGNNP